MLYSILCTHSGIWDQRTQISVTPNPSSLGTRLSAVPEGSGNETITLLPTAEWWMQIWKVLGRLSQNEWDHSVYRVNNRPTHMHTHYCLITAWVPTHLFFSIRSNNNLGGVWEWGHTTHTHLWYRDVDLVRCGVGNKLMEGCHRAYIYGNK